MPTYHPPSTKAPKPMPPEFPEMFVKGGWRMAEHLTGARTDLLLKWMEQAGPERLRTLRREYVRGDKTALERVRCPA